MSSDQPTTEISTSSNDTAPKQQHHLTRAERIQQQDSEVITTTFFEAARNVLGLVIPTILATIFSFGINRTVCMMVVGQYLTSHEIAIFGIGFSFYVVAGAGIPIGFGCAVDLLCSQATGKGRLDLAGQWMQTAFVVTFVICIPAMIIFTFFSGPFLSIFFEEVLARDLGTFMKYCAPYVLLQAWALTSARALQAQQRPDVPTLASFFSFIACTATSFVFIPKYGVNAAPCCLSFAMIVQLVATFIHGYIDGNTIITKVDSWNPLEWFKEKENGEENVGSMKRIKLYCSIGFPAMLSITSEWFSIESCIFVSSLLTEKEIAAAGVLWIMMTLFFNVPLSTSVASSSFVGNFLGANKPLHAEFYSCVCQTVNAGLLLLGSGFLVACGHWWFSLFASDKETLYIIYKSATAMIIFHNLEGWHISLQGIFRGTDEKWLHYTSKVVAISLWLIALPCAYIAAIKPPSFLIAGETEADLETSGVLRLFYGFCVGFIFEIFALVYAWRRWIPWSEIALEASKQHDEEENKEEEKVN